MLPSDVDDFVWRQILMAPRVTGNLRALAVDPSNGASIYVGTEEGTLVHSTDSGVTWEEVELSPFLLQSPTIEPSLTGPTFTAVDVFAGFHWQVGSQFRPFNPLVARGAGKGPWAVGPDLSLVFGNAPPYVVRPFENTSTGIAEPLLGAVAGKDPKPYDDIRRIRVCPGSVHTLFVVTSDKLFGSTDGSTFVPLFVGRDSAPLGDLACSPTDPNEVILTTGDGVYRSVDGGTSFDAMGGAIGSAATSSITFGPPGATGKPQLFVAAGTELWIGDPSDPEAMVLGPPGDSSGEIRYVAASAESVWVASSVGLRVSRDAGKTWTPVAELGGFDWQMVAITPASGGKPEHIAVLREDSAFQSVDGGLTFQPFFVAQSRRRLRQVEPSWATGTAAPGFVLVTSGEVWSSSPARPAAAGLDDRVVRLWAERRLKEMPSLSSTIDLALLKSKLSAPQVDDVFSRAKSRGWLPGVEANLSVINYKVENILLASVTNPAETTSRTSERTLGFFVDLVWELPEVVSSNYNVTAARKHLYDLRARFSFVVEDAYDERRQILSKIVAGGHDAEQLLTLQSRLEVLDVLLSEFTGDHVTRESP